MSEPTVTCPNCGTEIKLTESLAAPLLESTRAEFQQQLARKDHDIAQREQAISAKEKALSDARNKFNEQVAIQVEAQLQQDRARIAADETRKARQMVVNDLERKAWEVADLQGLLKTREEKLGEAQKAQAESIKKERRLDEAKRELELTVEKRVMGATAGMYGDLQGIAGKSLQEIEGLELVSLAAPDPLKADENKA